MFQKKSGFVHEIFTIRHKKSILTKTFYGIIKKSSQDPIKKSGKETRPMDGLYHHEGSSQPKYPVFAYACHATGGYDQHPV